LARIGARQGCLRRTARKRAGLPPQGETRLDGATSPRFTTDLLHATGPWSCSFA